jgi:glycosyltransferase involved in cell wall biosynthesis
MIGWLAELPALYCAVDVFVSASKTESFGLAIAEAMASGAAVVATETAGAQELIQSGESGVLVPIDDVEKMADELVRLLNDHNYRTRLGIAAQRTACDKFSVDRMISETEQIYRDALL